jgi:hypothetical protein
MPIVCRCTVYSPDYSTTYQSVHFCWLLELLWLDLNMIVAVRIVPSLVMITLNFALQNVSLERPTMSPEFEMQARSLNCKTKRHEMLLNETGRTNCGSWLNFACRNKRVGQTIHVLDPSINLQNSKTWKPTQLQTFHSSHGRKRHYTFQVK